MPHVPPSESESFGDLAFPDFLYDLNVWTMTLKYRFKTPSETHKRISTLEAARNGVGCLPPSAHSPFRITIRLSVHLAVRPPSVSLPFFAREALGVGCWQGKGGLRQVGRDGRGVMGEHRIPGGGEAEDGAGGQGHPPGSRCPGPLGAGRARGGPRGHLALQSPPHLHALRALGGEATPSGGQ